MRVSVWEKRAGILPNRGAGSKRKLNEHLAQAPQKIHSFSTGEFSVDFLKKFSARSAHGNFATTSSRKKLRMLARVSASPLLGRLARRDARIQKLPGVLRREVCDRPRSESRWARAA